MRGMMTGVANKFKSGPSLTAFYQTLSLNGSTQYVDFGNVVNVGSGSFTLSAWINLDTIQRGRIIDKEMAAPFTGFVFEVSASGKLQASVFDGSDGANAIGSTTLSTGVWYYVTAVYTAATNIKIYIDSILEQTSGSAAAVGSINTSSSLSVGRTAGTNEHFLAGSIAGPFIFLTDFSQSDINEVYNLGKAKQPEGYSSSITDDYAMALPLNTGVVDPYIDRSINGNNGTAIGSPFITGETLEFDLT